MTRRRRGIEEIADGRATTIWQRLLWLSLRSAGNGSARHGTARHVATVTVTVIATATVTATAAAAATAVPSSVNADGILASMLRVWCTYFGNEAGAYSENEENTTTMGGREGT